MRRWLREWLRWHFGTTQRSASQPRRKRPTRPLFGFLKCEALESREVPAVDLVGFDARSLGSQYAQNYFHVLEPSVAWGDSIHLNFNIANTGSTTTSGTFNVAFYLSTDSTIATSDTLLARYTGFSVPPVGNVSTFTNVSISLPASHPTPAASGNNYFIGMIVDSDNNIAESNESNDSNQGNGIDRSAVTVLPPVAVVTDSQGASTDHSVAFGSVVADGAGNAQAVQTVTLTDTAVRSLLKVTQNGIRLQTGTNFKILGILSNKLSQAVNVAGGDSLIAANSSETWTVQIAFDPVATGALTDALLIQTDDPANPTISVALGGTGTPRPNLVLTDSAGSPSDQVLNFGNVTVNGTATGTVTLTNNGSGPLTVSQNGITLPTGTPFSITGITSSTQGAINLASGPKTIAAGGAETWTVGLQYHPTATGLTQAPLTVLSNSPNGGTGAVSLLGTGQTPPHLVAPTSATFGGTFADGAGGQTATQTITLSNSGQLPLVVNQNGLSLATGTHFKLGGVVSSTQGTINVAAGPATLAPNGTETWVVTLVFDPTASGSLSDTLRVASTDPASPGTIGLSGVGLNQPGLRVVDDLGAVVTGLPFPAVLNDGAGNRSAAEDVLLKNVGTQPLTVSQNGISLLTGTHFRIEAITSSTVGAVNLAAGSATIAARGTETWTVRLRFDPTTTVNTALQDTLRIQSNDPSAPVQTVLLTGTGETPTVTPRQPYTQPAPISVSAGKTYPVTWGLGYYAAGDSTISVYADTDRNPTNGMTLLASGIDADRERYDWHIPTSLVGQQVNIYVAIADGTVVSGDYTLGSILVEPEGYERLLSAPITSGPNYTLSVMINGQVHNVPYTLNTDGTYLLDPQFDGKHFEYQIDRVPTLVDSDSTGYDEIGNPTSTTDAIGLATTFTYDFLSRVTRANYPDGTAVDYAYDAASNLTSMHDATGWQLYGYDTSDRLTSVTYSPTNNPADPAALTIGYGYDLDGRLTKLTYPSGKVVRYGYDNASKLTSVTEQNSGQPDLVTTYTYSSTTGLLTKTTRPNDTETVYTYDTNGQLIDILHRRTSTQAIILRYHYTLDAANRRTGMVTTTPTGATAQGYVYDDLERLSQATYSDNNGTIEATDRVVKYTYDKNGNRLTQTTYATGVASGATQTLTYAYGFENRLLGVTDQNGVVQASYAYDWRGNQVEKVTPTATTLYQYDSRNLLTSVDDGTNHVEYQYDGAGRRVGQTVNGVATRFVVDPSSGVYQTLEERTGSGQTQAAYVLGLDRIGGTLPGQSSETYYLADGLGSVGGLTGSSGASLGQYSYDVFGQTLTAPAGVPNPYQFTGESIDSVTGFVYLRARSYDPTTGRFVQKDPFGYSAGIDEYVYASGNPISYADPRGLQPEPFYTNNAETNSLGTRLIDFGADLITNNDSPQFTNLGGIGPGRNAQNIGNESAAIAAINNQPWSDADKQRDIAFAHHDFTLYEGGTSFYSPSVNTASAHLTLAIESPDIGTKIVFGTLGYFATIGAGLSETASAIGNALVSLGSTFYQADTAGLRPGGVIIDKAATLVNSDIKDITGATFDPVTQQLVFLGTSNPGTLHNVDLGLFTTAIQSVYGAAEPPFVTLDPPAKLLQQSFNLGDGDGVIANGKSGYVPISYTPYTPTNADDMTLTFNVNGSPVTVRLDAQVQDGNSPGGNTIIGGGRYAVLLKVGSVTGLPAGVTFTDPPSSVTLTNNTISGGTVTITFGIGYTLTVNAQGQQSNFFFSINNTSGAQVTITNVQLKPDLQHRKLGGRTDNTQLGWIMEEADRVMKELALGKDQSNGTLYTSQNAALPAGFQNVPERYLALSQTGDINARLWFTPNEETLKRYIDPVTGEATVVFDTSTVKLNTESNIVGLPSNPAVQAFADYFNAHFDQFAGLSFPVHDPNDTTGTVFIQVKIFDMLRDAMKAVALARFFHDNNIPLDTWWINSWKAPTATIPATIPTLTTTTTNGANTVTFYGGVAIKTPNTYLPDAVAASISAAVRAQRPAGTGDLPAQSYTVASGTSYGSLNAVATSLDDQKQDANVTLASTDLSFASTGGRQLAFDRYYNSGYLGDKDLGTGWQPTRFDLQFQLPSFVDAYRLMRDSSGNSVPVSGADSETYLRSGEIRLFDHATGQVLNFFSSLTTAYALDSQGNPVLATGGLTSQDVPTFAPGIYQDGSTLTQSPATHNYTLTRPDGSTEVFDPTGNLLSTTDARGNTITYGYDSLGRLSQITDAAGQKLAVTYGTDGRVQSVAGPEATGNPSRKVLFTYDAGGRLIQVDAQSLQGNGTYLTARTTRYSYNTSNQLASVTGPDGITTLTNTADSRGRSTQRQDALGNMVDNSFTQNTVTGTRTTTTVDMGTTGANDPTAQGVAALQYFAAGSTASQQFDSTARTTQTVNALGDTTQLGYTGDAQAPTSVTLPTPGRPAITIQRNAANLPTLISDPANTGGTSVRVVYNSANLPTDVTDTKGRVTHYTYTTFNAVQAVTTNYGTADAATTTSFYNAQKLLDHVTDPLGHTVASYTYDSMGRVLTAKDGDSVTTTYTYDSLGRLKRVYDPRLTGTTNYTEYTYNDNDQITRIALPTGAMTYQYDPLTHRLVSQTDLAGSTVLYGYDTASGLLTSATQVSSGGNAVTRYTYDRRGQLVLLTAPEGTTTAFQSDALGRPTAVVEDNGLPPTSTAVSEAPTSATTMTVTVTSSEPVLVASLEYWQVGQPESSAVTVSQRLGETASFSFNLTGVDTTKHYNYKLALTDQVGRSQTSPAGVLDSAPTATVSLNTASPRTQDVLTATASSSDREGDQTTLTFAWKVNGVVKQTHAGVTGLTDTFDLSQPGNGSRGDVVTVEVTATDGTLAGSTATASATVADTPPTASVALNSSSPRTADVLTATATTSDPDGDAVTLTYVWAVNGAVKRTHTTAGLTDTFDLSQPGNGDRGDIVTVAVTPTDSTMSGTAASASATVADSAPMAIAMSPSSVPENRPAGALVGTISVVDPDLPADTHTFALVSGAGGAGNGSFTLVGNQLRTAVGFDYEAQGNPSIRVRATDAAGMWVESVITVMVTNVNEPPVIVSNGGGATASVSVSSSTTAVTTVAATDPDAGTTFTYSISGGADAADFRIDPTTGALSFTTPPDYEHPASAAGTNVYSVVVEATDNGSPSLSATQALAVTVTESPPPPPPPPPLALLVPQPPAIPRIVVGSDPGGLVRVLDAQTHQTLTTFAPYVGFAGPITVAMGDVTGDGIADIITGTGPGNPPHVKVFDGTSFAEVASFFAFAPGFVSGVFVAAGNVNGDQFADIIVGAGPGAGPHVKVFDGTKLGLTGPDGQLTAAAELASFFAFDVGYRGGLTVGAGDLNGDGRDDVLVGSASIVGHVKAFDATRLQSVQPTGVIDPSAELRSFLPYPGFLGGIFVAGGDINGDGVVDLITGANVGPGHVKVFSGVDNSELRSFLAYPGTSGGVRVGAAEFDAAAATLFLAPGTAGSGRVSTDLLGLPGDEFVSGFVTGIYVGATRR